MTFSKYLAYFLILLVVGFYSNVLAQEHPTSKKKDTAKHEHPTKTEHPKKAEHPAKAEHPTKESVHKEHPTKKEHPCSPDMKKGNKEHPAKEGSHEHPAKHKKAELTIVEFADAVDHYVAAQEKKSGGYFLVKDQKQNKVLKCKLEKIHKKRLASLGNNEYFVCADFKANDGNTYDIDIFMQGTSKDNLKATRTMVHKDNGTPRYTWYEEDGVWKTQPYKKNNK